MKSFVTPALVVGACLAGAALFVGGCVFVAHEGAHVVTQWSMSEKATRAETRRIPLAEGGALAIELPGGDIDLAAGEANEIELSADLTAFGESTEDARAALERTKLVVEEGANGVRIALSQTQDEKGRKRSPLANLKLRVPRDVRLDLRSGSGDVRTSGPIGSSKLRSGYGSVRVALARGDLSLESGSGDVELGKLERAERLTARSGYGSVVARDVEARDVELSSSSGDVELTDARSERVTLSSSYGAIVAERIDGELTAKTSSGAVRASALRGEKGSLTSGYGPVHVDGARGSLEAKSSSGDVRVRNFSGSCRAKSSYGSVDVEGVLSGAALESSSGDVRAHAAAGSTLADGATLRSGYGSVVLEVPRELSFDLAAKSGYGELDVRFPVTVEAGGLKKQREVRGRVGARDGSAPRFEVTTSSGGVRVAPID